MAKRTFPKSVTNFQPTEDDFLSGSPMTKRVRITLVAEVDIPLDAVVDNGSIFTDTGYEITPVIGFMNLHTGKSTTAQDSFRKFAADGNSFEYLLAEDAGSEDIVVQRKGDA